MNKTIALFGLSGRTGKPLHTLLLNNGYAIKALVRTPNAITTTHDALTILQGNILRPDDVARTIEGTDAVVSVIGHVRGDQQSPRVQTEGTRHILAAMQQHGVQRLVSLTGGAVPYTQDQPKFADKLIRGIMNLVAKDALADAIAHAELIQRSATQWTIIRAPRLLEKPAEGAYRVGWVGVNASTSLTYGDLAAFIAKELEAGTYIHSMPFVSR